MVRTIENHHNHWSSVGSTVRSGIGSGAILVAQTSSIGQITGTKLNNIGFDYPSDRTLKVIPNLPDIVEIDRLSSLDYVEVTYQGQNYPAPPDIVVIDGFTKEVLGDVDLEMVLGEDRLKIIQNTEGIYNVEPRIVPIGNPNGIGIRDLTYSAMDRYINRFTNTVRLFLIEHLVMLQTLKKVDLLLVRNSYLKMLVLV